jgi:hypothetical protein
MRNGAKGRGKLMTCSHPSYTSSGAGLAPKTPDATELQQDHDASQYGDVPSRPQAETIELVLGPDPSAEDMWPWAPSRHRLADFAEPHEGES